MSSLSSRKNLVALFAITLASLMFGLEISSVPVILPILEKLLHAGFKDMQWVMNAYTIACTTVLMAAGTLADRYGRKRVFLGSLCLFGATSLLCGLAQRADVLIVGRFLQGLGGGAMLICQIAILSQQFRESRERARAFALWGIVFGVGLGFGPIVGGTIVALSDWRWVFLVHVLLTALTLTLALLSVEESRDAHAGRLDVFGILFLSLAVFGVTYFITQGPELGFASAKALGILALAGLSFIAFLWAERVHPRPMFDFAVFGIRDFSGAILGSVGMNFSFWPCMIYLPIFFQSGLGYDAVQAGLALLAYTLPTLATPPLAERLVLRFGPRVVIPAGMGVIGLGFMLMYRGSSVADASWLSMLPGALLAGIGLGLTNTPVTNTTTAAVPAERAGMASGIDMSARLITLAVNIALMGFVLLQGVLAQLRAVSPTLPETTLRGTAAAIAAGQPVASLSPALAHAALAHGFGLVLLYGGIGVWLLAGLSYAVFPSAKTKSSPVCVDQA